MAHETLTLDRLGWDEKRVTCISISLEEHNLLARYPDVRLQQFDARAAQADGEDWVFLKTVFESLQSWKAWAFWYHPAVWRNSDRVWMTRRRATLREVHVGV